MDLDFKSARIADFCDKLSGFVDFETTVDRGSAANFGPDSRLCLSWYSDRGFSSTKFGSVSFDFVLFFMNESNVQSLTLLLKLSSTICYV